MRQVRFWLRWSLRDLRRRWIQVLATALVIAIGVAVFAGLGGMRGWREDSARASFSALALHDVRVTLAEGTFVDKGRLRAALERSAGAAGLPAVQERLVVPTQIDTRGAEGQVLTPGRIVGVPLGDGQEVDEINVMRGTGLGAGDADEAVAVLDRSYANFYDLPDAGTISLPGGRSLRYVGQGQSPQYFLITSESGFGGEPTLGVLYTSLATAQRLAGRPGEVNEAVARFAPGTNLAFEKRQVEQALARYLPDVKADVTTGPEEQAYRILFRDAKNDQRYLSFFGLLVLLGACVAAFNLVSRTVEAERREIGIGMALGVRTSLLGLRPLLLGFEIALLGTVLGALLAVWIADAFTEVYKEFLPMPVYGESFRPTIYVRAAAVGFALPLLAIVWPVWRGVRVQPIEAIRVGLRSAQGGGLAPLAKRIRMPGAVMAQMALRNLARTPRRTLLATIGLAGVLGAMVALVGIVDSYGRTIDVARADAAGDAPRRLSVTLDGFYPVAGREMRRIAATPGVHVAEPRIDVLAAAGNGREEIPVVLSVVDAGSDLWRPGVEQGEFRPGEQGIVIPPKLAKDLGVSVGDKISLNHPVLSRDGLGSRMDEIRVAAIGKNPFRVFTFVDERQANSMGLTGATNSVAVMPRDGVSIESVQRALLALPGVATTRPVTADTDALEDTIGQFASVIQVAALAVLALAILMAFNLAGISIEERRREYTTMFAFGLPVRSGMRVAITENLIVGLLGTALGFAIGMLTISWMIDSLLGDTWPEIGIVRNISPGTIALTVAVGVLAVALTPLLMTRRMTRMDIPSTLRVME